jgi:CheY-like chemotaxis protein
VTLKVHLSKEQENTCVSVFSVADTGIGIKTEDIGKLFQDYTQLDAKANRNIEGTGLGLSITQRLISLMHGSISVESVYSVGSTFTVRLPIPRTTNEEIGLKTARELMSFTYKKGKTNKKDFKRSQIPPGKVLVVDDLDLNLVVAKGLLKHYGLKIDTATSGPEAIEKIRLAGLDLDTEKYDIIFMDHMMPKMDGIEATHIIRKELGTEYAKTVPIIALTANAVAGSREMFLQNGFNSFISKPIDLAQLDTELTKWIKKNPSTPKNV